MAEANMLDTLRGLIHKYSRRAQGSTNERSAMDRFSRQPVVFYSGGPDDLEGEYVQGAPLQPGLSGKSHIRVNTDIPSTVDNTLRHERLHHLLRSSNFDPTSARVNDPIADKLQAMVRQRYAEREVPEETMIRSLVPGGDLGTEDQGNLQQKLMQMLMKTNPTFGQQAARFARIR